MNHVLYRLRDDYLCPYIGGNTSEDIVQMGASE